MTNGQALRITFNASAHMTGSFDVPMKARRLNPGELDELHAAIHRACMHYLAMATGPSGMTLDFKNITVLNVQEKT